MNKKALITGITGQDGAYLAEFLLEKGYEVHGIKRRASSFNTDRIDHLYQENRNFILHYGDLTDATNLIRILQQVQPDEVYNLAAQSHVAVSFESPEYTADTDALGTLRLLEGIRLLGLENKTRFYQASTSELYGKVRDYVRMQWLMLQQDRPEDFVIATGEQHSVREFVDIAAQTLGMKIQWHGKGIHETGLLDGRTILAVDPAYFRPTEVDSLLGNPAKAREKLGWTPKIPFQDLITEMVTHDLAQARRDKLCTDAGFPVHMPSGMIA
jgi:GDP-D-mannose dehydratase